MPPLRAPGGRDRGGPAATVVRPKRGLTAQIALSLLKKVVEVEKAHPELAERVAGLKKAVEESLRAMRGELATLDEHERKLMTVSLMNFIHDKADQLLVD